MKTFKQFREEHDFLDLYRRFSTPINKSLIGGSKEKKLSFMKHFDTSGKGEHEYEHHDTHAILSNLDSHTDHPSNALTKATTSYSGVSKEFGAYIASQPHGHTIHSPAYLSSSHDLNIAKGFAERDNRGLSHVMQFHLPVGYQKSKDIPNAREGGKAKAKERLFARNQTFKHIGSEKKGGIHFHHYEPE